MNLHDWIAAWGVLLGQIGGGGLAGPGEDCWARGPDIGYPKFTDPVSPKGERKGKRKAVQRGKEEK